MINIIFKSDNDRIGILQGILNLIILLLMGKILIKGIDNYFNIFKKKKRIVCDYNKCYESYLDKVY